MKRIFTFLLAVCCSTAVLAQNDSQTPYQTKSLANDAISKVTVSTMAGGIMVTGQSGQQPRVEVYIKGNNNHQFTKEQIEKKLADDYDMNITVNGHELKAIVKTKHDKIDWKNALSISFKIYVPEQVSTDLTTSGGGIQLSYLKGKQDFTTSGGGLTIDRLSGEMHGRTSGGGITVSNSNDDIDLVTSGGGITAKDCGGNISLVTSGGGIQFKNLQGKITATTSGGGIEGKHVSGELEVVTSGGGIQLADMNCSLDANTSAGSLDVQVAHAGKYLKLNASAGNISLKLPAKQGFDLDLNAQRITDQIANDFHGSWTKENVNGSVNGGGIKVEAHSNDNIDVKFD